MVVIFPVLYDELACNGNTILSVLVCPRNNSFSLVAMLRAGRPGIGVRFPPGTKTLLRILLSYEMSYSCVEVFRLSKKCATSIFRAREFEIDTDRSFETSASNTGTR
jgi:hypothetical protein